MPRFLNHSAFFTIRIILVSFITLFSAFALFAQTPPNPAPTASPTPTPEATVLKPNQPLERQIKGGDTHVFHIEMKAGQTARTEVVQKGIDVIVSLYDPAGKLIVEMDGKDGRLWRETVTAISDNNKGIYRVEVKAYGKPEKRGSYVIELKRLGKAEPNDSESSTMEKVLSQGRKLYEKGGDSLKEAITKFEQAGKFWSELGNKQWEAVAIYNKGECLFKLNQLEDSVKIFGNSLSLAKEIGDKNAELKSLIGIGKAYSDLEQYSESNDYYVKALEFAKELDDKIAIAFIAHQIGFGNYVLGRLEKSLEFYEQALKARKDINDLNGVAGTLNNMSLLYGRKDLEKKTGYLKQALAAYKEVKNQKGEAVVLMNLALLSGDFKTAMSYFEQSLSIRREIGDKKGEGDVLHNIGLLNFRYGNIEAAKSFYDQAIKIRTEINDRSGQADSLSGLGNIYDYLGQLQKAKELYEGALIRYSAVQNIWKKALTLSNLGDVNQRLRQYEKAKESYEQALVILRELGATSQEATTLLSLGILYRLLGQFDKSKESLEKSLDIHKRNGNLIDEAYTLQGLGQYYLSVKDYQKARDYNEKALHVSRRLIRSDLEVNSLVDLSQVYNALEMPDVAIFYGKQSVNVIQEIRGNIKGLDKDLQESFLKSKEDIYRELADLLISQGRFREAQQVLDMLKESEYFEFIRRDAAEIAKLSKRVDLTEKEKAVLESYTKLSDRITQIGQEFGKLETKKQKLGKDETLTPEEDAKYKELEKQLADANEAFRIFLEKDLVAQLSVEAAKGIELDKGLQADLKKWETGTVSVYTVLATDRYRAVVTTPYTQTDGKTEIKPAELNKKIFQFRAALTNPASDPKRLGKELYDILIKPIEKDLSGAKTILWSLDGPLRYVPVSALWDGKQYLVEKYRNIVLTPSTRKNITQQNTQDWSALAGGVSTEQEIQLSEGEEKIKFSPLPKVIKELREIVIDEKATEQKAVAVGSRQIRTKTTNTTGSKQTRSQTGTGIFSGKVLLDEEFNEKNLTGEIRKEITAGKRQYNLLHVASHFRLGSSMANSFLLTGDGKYITLEQIKRSEGFDLRGMELVTLSACNTGFDGGTGAEVDSLATLLESRGAKASLSSLWEVPDESTYALMIEFYRIKKMNPKLSKAEALRQSQLKLLKGTGKTPTQFAHPFYWSPFVMVGNWR